MTRRLPLLLSAAVLTLVCATGCGGGPETTGDAPAATTTAAAGPSVVESPAQKVTFGRVRAAVDALYRSHPEIASFVVQDVQYNATTRDKVLQVCRRGGRETDPASLESVRVAGCAPLIFFFYNFGQQSSVRSSSVLARKLYWYAATSIRGPFDARASLTALLRSWGIP